MVFKKLLGSLGVGGPTVDTILESGAVHPGGMVRGQVHLQGGKAAFDIEHIVLELVAQPGSQPGGGGSEKDVVPFAQHMVGGGFPLGEGEKRALPFAFPLPWEAPVTEANGHPLGISVGVRTALVIASAKDSGDMDPLAVAPLPAQDVVLQALGQLGFGFQPTVLVPGPVPGTAQQLPFHQEFLFAPSPQYAQVMGVLEVSFAPAPDGLHILLESDKHTGMAVPGLEVRETITQEDLDAGERDWQAEVESWVAQLAEGRQQAFQAAQAMQGMQPGMQPGMMQQGQQSRGGGMGGAVAAGAAGVAGGLVGGMLLNQAMGGFGDDDEDGGDDGADDGGGDFDFE